MVREKRQSETQESGFFHHGRLFCASSCKATGGRDVCSTSDVTAVHQQVTESELRFALGQDRLYRFFLRHGSPAEQPQITFDSAAGCWTPLDAAGRFASTVVSSDLSSAFSAPKIFFDPTRNEGAPPSSIVPDSLHGGSSNLVFPETPIRGSCLAIVRT